MQKTIFAMGALLLLSHISPASAETRRFCETDKYGTRTCTVISTTRTTDRIMGMPAKKYIRGLRQGKCMPSPSGACGGG